MAKAGRLGRSAWPVLPDRDVGAAVAAAVEGRREASGQARSVVWELGLPELVDEVIDWLVEHPGEAGAAGVSPYVLSELAEGGELRERVWLAGLIQASLLYPLSILIYGWPGHLEEISVHQAGVWTVDDETGRYWLTEEGDPYLELSGGDRRAAAAALVEDLRRILQTDGVNGTRELSLSTPYAETSFGRLCRLSVAIAPVVAGETGVQAAIRLPGANRFQSLDQMIGCGAISPGGAAFLRACVETGVNILIAGGTQTGKTTWLRLLCGLIPEGERVTCIEDSAELRLEADSGSGRPWVRLCHSFVTTDRATRGGFGVGLGELVVHGALRYAPDRIILGEARGAEMGPILNALTTGHDGSMLTIHADSGELAIGRLVDCAIQSDSYRDNESLALRRAHQAVHVVMHLAKLDGRRVVTEITAVHGAVDQFVPVYRRSPALDRLELVEPRLDNLPPRLTTRLKPRFAAELPR